MTVLHPTRFLGAACLLAIALSACQAIPVQPAATEAARLTTGLMLDAGEPDGVTLTVVPSLAAGRRLLAAAPPLPYQPSDIQSTEVALYQLTDDASGAEAAMLKRAGAISGDPEGQTITLSGLRKNASYRLGFKARSADGTVLTSPEVQFFNFAVDAAGDGDLSGPLTLTLAGSAKAGTVARFPSFNVTEGGYPVKGYVHEVATLPATGGGLTFASDGTAYVIAGAGIVKVAPDGTVSPLAVTGLSTPQDLALDATETHLYIADSGHDALFKVAVTGGAATSVSAAITDPMSVAVGPDDHLYASTTSRVVRVNRAGDVAEWVSAHDQAYQDVQSQLGAAGPNDTELIAWNNAKIAARAATISLRGLNFGPKGVLYVADAGNGNVWKVAPNRALTREVAFTGRKPVDVVFGTDERRYIATSDARLYFMDGLSVPEPLAGGAASAGADGAYGAAVKFTTTTAIAQDPSGYLYVVDNGGSSSHLRKVL